jgi:peptidoglycan/LPS O-acetylase OafA/YrhL
VAVNLESNLAPKRLRLNYLDGLRGLAALYVVLYHASDPSWAEGRLSRICSISLKLLIYGHFAVAIFIILSGYCLMLPLVRSADQQLQGGWSGFIRRRARRILPPYYTAIVLTMILLSIIPPLRVVQGNYWDGALPAFRTDIVLSHLLLIHNLSPQWYFRINPPLWSVATEWQIYFCFPLLLLPIWKRFGIAWLITIAFAIGLAPHFLLPTAWNLDWAVPWYLALFSLGMGAAAINFAPGGRYAAWRARVRWELVPCVMLSLIAVAATVTAKWWWKYLWFADIQVGLFAACLLIHWTRQLHALKSSTLLALVESKASLRLGHISYSLYLVHAPLLALLHLPLHKMHLSPDMRMMVMLCVNVPITVALSYLFHLAFERRFMSDQRPPTPTVGPVTRRGAYKHEG